MLVPLYLALKAGWSRANDWLVGHAKRRPIPQFSTPQAVAAYLDTHSRYTGDPLGGALDFYTHPERLQYAFETGDWSGGIVGLRVDCDESSWAVAALRCRWPRRSPAPRPAARRD